MQEVDALREREKELRCLYRIQQLTFNSTLPLESVFQQLVEAIPPGWQHPDFTGASVEYFGRRYCGDGYESSAPQLREKLYLGERCVGQICVSDCSLKSGRGSFLEEEAMLLVSISRMLSNFLEWRHLEILGSRLGSVTASRRQWREQIVQSMVERFDSSHFGVTEFFLREESPPVGAEPADHIELQVFHRGTPTQEELLRVWLDGWSLSMAEMARVQTGERFPSGIFHLKWLSRKPEVSEESKLRNLTEAVEETPKRSSSIRELEQVEGMVQRTLLGLSHELRNPLAAVSTNLDLLRRDLPPRARCEIVKETEQALSRISTLVADLMLFLRAETGLEKPQLEEVDLAVFLQKKILELKQKEPRNSIVELGMTPEADCKVRLSRRVTSRILGDLVANAVRYSRSETVSVSVVERNEETVFVSVKDHGCGIEEIHHDKLFEQFYRLESSRDRDTGGVGLGLPLARALARCQNSDLEFSSIPGQGTEVRLVFRKGG